MDGWHDSELLEGGTMLELPIEVWICSDDEELDFEEITVPPEKCAHHRTNGWCFKRHIPCDARKAIIQWKEEGGMKPHYFEQGRPDEDDIQLKMAIGQGYVPKTCLLNGIVVMSEVSEARHPCDGCGGPREKCHGHPLTNEHFQPGVKALTRDDF
jgi:hypothetical protein